MRRLRSALVPLTAGLPPLKEWLVLACLLPLTGLAYLADELLPESLSGMSPCFATLKDV